MTNAKRKGKKSPKADKSIAELASDNEVVTSELKVVADELNVVHTVLDLKVPETARQGDVDAAIARTDELEKKLSESIEMLEVTTEMLKQKA